MKRSYVAEVVAYVSYCPSCGRQFDSERSQRSKRRSAYQNHAQSVHNLWAREASLLADSIQRVEVEVRTVLPKERDAATAY